MGFLHDFQYCTLGCLIQEIELLAKYCHIQGIPFPKINPSKEERENPKECYVFKDEDNPQAPMLLYFPLVNASFKKFTAPGKFSVHEFLQF